MKPERLYFYLHFALDIIVGDRCDRKNTKQLFCSSKTSSFGGQFSNNITLGRNARFEVI